MNSIDAKNEKELLKSIRDNTVVRLCHGNYDISNVNATENVRLEDVCDGKALIVHDINNLVIQGNHTKIYTQNRYATVLTFIDCSNIELSGLCIGHYPIFGHCIGDVLCFIDCENVKLNGVELFGCGVIGLVSHDTKNLVMNGCHVFTCSGRAMEIDHTNIKLLGVEVSECKELTDSILYMNHSELEIHNCFIHNNSMNGYLFEADHSVVKMDSVMIANNDCHGVCLNEQIDSCIVCDEKEGIIEFSCKKEEPYSINVIIKPSIMDDEYSQYSVSFAFNYNADTRIRALIKTCYQYFPEPYNPIEHNERYSILFKEQYLELNEESSLKAFLDCFAKDGSIVLYYAIGLPGGYGLDEINGVSFFLHSNENGHTPHIHAEYQGDEVSVDVNSLEVTGKMKNKKKLKFIKNYVKTNRDFILEEYYLHTNGIYVDPHIWYHQKQ